MTTEQIINEFEIHLKNIAIEWNLKLREKENEKIPVIDLSAMGMMSEFDFLEEEPSL